MRASSSGRDIARSTFASPCGRSNSCAAQHPGLRVIVHPEVPWEVVQAADDSGFDRIHHQPGEDQSRWIRVGRGDRGASGEPPRQPGRSRPHGPVARPVRLPVLDDVPRVAEPSACGCWKGWWRAKSTTGSSFPKSRSTGTVSRSTGCYPSGKRAESGVPLGWLSRHFSWPFPVVLITILFLYDLPETD